MTEVLTALFGVVAWIAGCVLLAAMWFDVYQKTFAQILRRRVAAAALFCVWLMIGIQFYRHVGLAARFF